MTSPLAVFVHGAGGGAWEWEFWLNVFAEHGWDTLASDLLPSESGLAHTQVDDYVQQIRDSLAELALDASPVLIGASMAGPLILKVCEEIPAAAVVLVNSLPVAGVDGWPQGQVAFPDVIPWAAKGLAGRSLQDMVDYDAALGSVIDEVWRDESGSVLNRLYAGLDVAVPSCPCLVVHGSEDQDVSATLGFALANYLKADFLMLQGVSHLGVLFGRRAEETADLVALWCESVVSTDGDLNEIGGY